jgi:hypothetical protein
MYIDMPDYKLIDGDNKQFLFVLFSSIISIIYLKKKWYEYLGLWMLFISFSVFFILTIVSREKLFLILDVFLTNNKGDRDKLFDIPNNIFGTIVNISTPIFQKILGLNATTIETFVRRSSLIAFVIGCTFLFIFIALLVFLDASTAIVRKKHEGKITGIPAKDDEYQSRPFIITDLDFLEDTIDGNPNGEQIYNNLRSGFDSTIVAILSLILVVFGNQVTEYLPKGVVIGLLVVLLLISFISSIVGLSFSGEALKVKPRLQD